MYTTGSRTNMCSRCIWHQQLGYNIPECMWSFSHQKYKKAHLFRMPENVILQISPTRCTILLNIFIYLLYMFLATMCPLSGENYCIYVALVFVTLYRWRPVCCLVFNPTSRPDTTYTECQYQCRTDTVIFSWWWAHGCPKGVEKRNKYIKQNCAPSWTYLRDCTGMRSQRNVKFRKCEL
jgi:hypothetical protein